MDTERKRGYAGYFKLALMTLILCIMGGAAPLHAITRIYGKVTDSITQKAIPYVSVYLQNSTDGCQTDKEGLFSFLSAESHGTLIVSSVGYEEKHTVCKCRRALSETILKIILILVAADDLGNIGGEHSALTCIF